MPLINCKVELSLRWIENCVLAAATTDSNVNNTSADSATFKLSDARLYVPSKDCLLLLMIIQKAIIKVLLVLSRNIFFQELR